MSVDFTPDTSVRGDFSNIDSWREAHQEIKAEGSEELREAVAKLRKADGLTGLSNFAFIRLLGQVLYEAGQLGMKFQVLQADGQNRLMQTLDNDRKVSDAFFSNAGSEPPNYAAYEGEYELIDLNREPIADGEDVETHTFVVNGEPQEFVMVKGPDGGEYFVPVKDPNDPNSKGVDLTVNEDGNLVVNLDPANGGQDPEEIGVPIPVGLLAYSSPNYNHELPINPETGLFHFGGDQEAKDSWLSGETERTDDVYESSLQSYSTGLELIMANANRFKVNVEGMFGLRMGSERNRGDIMSRAFR